jgi:hypothetical protein
MKKRAKMRMDCRGQVVPVVGKSATAQMKDDGMKKMNVVAVTLDPFLMDLTTLLQGGLIKGGKNYIDPFDY